MTEASNLWGCVSGQQELNSGASRLTLDSLIDELDREAPAPTLALKLEPPPALTEERLADPGGGGSPLGVKDRIADVVVLDGHGLSLVFGVLAHSRGRLFGKSTLLRQGGIGWPREGKVGPVS